MAHKTVRSSAMTSMVIRGAYFFIHEQRTKDGQGKQLEKPRYEFVGLIPKTNADPAQCANYRQFADVAMSVVAQVPEWGGQFPAGGNWPISNGDEAAKLVKSPWRAGHWIIKFSANFPPKVAVMQNSQPVEIPARRIGSQELYKSGDYCIVSTYCFSYDEKSRGVKFDFEGVLFVGAGDPIGAAQRSVNQMFAGTTGTVMPAASLPAPAAAAPQYAPPQAPAAYAPPVASAPPAPALAPPTATQYAPPAPSAPAAPPAPTYAAAPPLAPAPPAPGVAPLPAFPAPR